MCPVAFNQGHLFSSTVNGGTQGSDCRQGCGTVFTFGQQSALQPPYYLLAYAFKDGTDGRFPEGLLAFDGEGNVYGTTSAGGLANHGTVYMLTPEPQHGRLVGDGALFVPGRHGGWREAHRWSGAGCRRNV